MPRMSEEERMSVVDQIADKLIEAVGGIRELVDDIGVENVDSDASASHARYVAVKMCAMSMVFGELLGMKPRELEDQARQAKMWMSRQVVANCVERLSRGDEPS